MKIRKTTHLDALERQRGNDRRNVVHTQSPKALDGLKSAKRCKLCIFFTSQTDSDGKM